MSEPLRLPVDPAVALWAYRWPSARDPRITYDVAMLLGEDGRPPYVDCTCPGFTYRDSCKHVDVTLALRRADLRSLARQVWLDERQGCRHPLTVDEDGPDMAHIRMCVGCGEHYDRSEAMTALRVAIRERHRLPSSPYTAEERSRDPS